MEYNYEKYALYAEELKKENDKLNYITYGEKELIYIGKIKKHLNKRISFTPYIYNACSANCRFCSEKLNRDKDEMKNFNLSDIYFEKLKVILNMLKDNEIFLSISGMEPLESLEFLEDALKVFKDFEDEGIKIISKVIYSNLSAGTYNLEKVLEIIKKYKITSVETSRHHYDENVNNKIVNFKNELIKQNKNYESIVQKLNKIINLKLVCVLQKTGVNSYKEVENYINWAKTLGIKSIVFRELSIFNDSIAENEVSKYIKDNRVQLINILKEINSDNFKIKEIYKGYYYFSFRYLYKGDIEVTFEASDYEEMIRKHNKDEIQKLIYYPNGDLCCDWNMRNKIF